MTGYKVFQYYLATKLHFTTKSFDVFKNNGRVRTTLEQYNKRKEKRVFEAISKQFSTDRDCVEYFVANFLYDNKDVLYTPDESRVNYTTFIKRKQSLTQGFSDDLDFLLNSNSEYFTLQKIPDVLKYTLSGDIKIESLIILDSIDNFLEPLLEDSTVQTLLGDFLLRSVKGRKFIKINNKDRIMTLYNDFKEELTAYTS